MRHRPWQESNNLRKFRLKLDIIDIEMLKISRLRSPSDHAAAARLMAASDPWKRLGITYDRCLNSVKAPFGELYAARDGSEIRGLVQIIMYGTLKGYIRALCVAPGCRDMGLGARLMLRAERRIAAVSPNVFLCVSSFNKDALRFYKRLGYKKTGVLKDFLVKGSDELLLRKTTGPLLSFKRAYKRKP